MVAVCREIRRVLRPDGTFWLNLGDSFAGGGHGHRDPERWPKQSRNDHHPIHAKKYPSEGLKLKDLCMVPARVVLALQADGWWIRSRITVCKENGMPESAGDRPTSATEDLYLLSKSAFYFYDADAVRERQTGNTHSRGHKLSPPKEALHAAAGNGHAGWTRSVQEVEVPGGRNMRNWWPITGEPMTERAYDFEGADFLDSYGLPHTRSDECPVHGGSDNTDDTPCGWCPLSVTSHSATFSRSIPRKAILAGTSAKGCCDRCGAPWVRITEKASARQVADYNGKWLNSDPQSSGRRILANVHAARMAGGDHDNPFPERKTIGWKPTCKCNAGVAPCVVLDPFFGSGTTGEVAEELGRRWIGVDLNWNYASQIAVVRTAQMGLRFGT